MARNMKHLVLTVIFSVLLLVSCGAQPSSALTPAPETEAPETTAAEPAETEAPETTAEDADALDEYILSLGFDHNAFELYVLPYANPV